MNIMRKKSVQLMVTLLLASGIILAGTFAWFSFSQNALNVFDGFTNPDVNIHDDYEMGDVNKDVYVENSGSRPLYVRIRFDEYMELDGNSIIGGVLTSDKGTPDRWHTHSYSAGTVDNCGEAPHDYYSWVMGGAGDPQKGAKLYLPAPSGNRATFKEDGTAVKQPIAVTYDDNNEEKFQTVYGKDAGYAATETGKEAYARIDAKLKTLDADDVGGTATLKDSLAALFETLSQADTAQKRKDAQAAIDAFTLKNELGYWDKVFDVKPDGTYNTTFKVNFVPLKSTLTTKQVYTMAEWIAAGTPTGSFWIMDTDGWCYWGDILLPNQASGLLLSEVLLENSPAGKWYYGINTRLQAVTFDDFNKFSDPTLNSTITDYGLMVLQAASGNYVYDRNPADTTPNPPTYTFVNNKDNTYRMMISDGTNKITYGPNFIYTGSVPPATTGDIYKGGDDGYLVGKTFTKDIPFGNQATVFTVLDARNSGNTADIGSGVATGDDGKHYLKLQYTKAGATAVAWLAAGADKKFDALLNGASLGTDILIWTDTDKIPGSGSGDRTVEDASSSYKINDTFTVDGHDWVIVGLDNDTSKTLIVSKDVLGTAMATQADAVTELATYKTGLTELIAADSAIKPKLLTIDEAIGYFANHAAMVATDGTTADAKKWWLDGGIIGTNGAPGAVQTDNPDTYIRVAFWIDGSALQTVYDKATEVAKPNITPKTATFDKKAGGADVALTIDLGKGQLAATTIVSVKNGTTTLAKTTDYTASGDALTISKAYLANQTKDTSVILNVEFNDPGKTIIPVVIKITDTTTP